MIENLYNYEITVLFIGGLFAWFLSATIKSIKHVHMTELVEKEDSRHSTNLILNIRLTLADTGVQPLLIIVFVNLLNQPHELNILGAVCLVMFIMFHEFYLTSRYSGKLFYQLIIMLVWIVYFLSTSYWTNLYINT